MGGAGRGATRGSHGGPDGRCQGAGEPRRHRRRGLGVPGSGRDRRRWIGASPAGPLEKRIRFELDGEGHDWPIWKVWRTVQERGLSREELPAAVAKALTPAETLEALAEVSGGAYRIETPTGTDVSAELIAKVAAGAGPQAAEWARRYADETLALVEASSTPELGGVLGMPGFAPIAVYLALLNAGSAVEPRWYRFVPLVPVPIARIVLEKMQIRRSARRSSGDA